MQNRFLRIAPSLGAGAMFLLGERRAGTAHGRPTVEATNGSASEPLTMSLTARRSPSCSLVRRACGRGDVNGACVSPLRGAHTRSSGAAGHS